MNVRNATIDILEGHNIKDSSKTNITFNIFYNVIPSMIIMIIISIICLIKKKFIMPLIFGMQLLKAFAIIYSAPDCFFMYYLPTYMTGYVILTMFIICLKDKNKWAILI